MGYSRTNEQSGKIVRKSQLLHSCCFQSLSALWYGLIDYAEDWIQQYKRYSQNGSPGGIQRRAIRRRLGWRRGQAETAGSTRCNWWFGARWFGFLRSPYERDSYLGVPLDPEPPTQTTNLPLADYHGLQFPVKLVFRSSMIASLSTCW